MDVKDLWRTIDTARIAALAAVGGKGGGDCNDEQRRGAVDVVDYTLLQCDCCGPSVDDEHGRSIGECRALAKLTSHLPNVSALVHSAKRVGVVEGDGVHHFTCAEEAAFYVQNELVRDAGSTQHGGNRKAPSKAEAKMMKAGEQDKLRAVQQKRRRREQRQRLKRQSGGEGGSSSTSKAMLALVPARKDGRKEGRDRPRAVAGGGSRRSSSSLRQGSSSRGSGLSLAAGRATSRPPNAFQDPTGGGRGGGRLLGLPNRGRPPIMPCPQDLVSRFGNIPSGSERRRRPGRGDKSMSDLGMGSASVGRSATGGAGGEGGGSSGASWKSLCSTESDGGGGMHGASLSNKGGGTSGGKSGGNVPDGDDASGDDDNDDGRWLDAAKGIEYWEGAETSNQSSTSEKQPRRRNTKRRRVWDSFLYEVPRTPMFSAAQERSMGGLRGALGASMEARTVLEQQAAAANPRGGHASSSSSSSSSSTTPHQRSNEQRLREICVAMLQKQLPANAQRDQTKVRTTEDLAYTIAAAAVSAKQAGGMAGAEVRMESVRDDSARCFVSSLYIVMCVTNDANDG